MVGLRVWSRVAKQMACLPFVECGCSRYRDWPAPCAVYGLIKSRCDSGFYSKFDLVAHVTQTKQCSYSSPCDSNKIILDVHLI